MHKDSLYNGLLAVVDPTTQIAPARSAAPPVRTRTFTDGVDRLLAELDRTSAAPPRDITDKDLSFLRLAAVGLSFVSAVVTVLCLPALAFDIQWPLILVAVASIASTVLIIWFFTALRRAISIRAVVQKEEHQRMKAVLEAIARTRIEDMETRKLLDRSKNSPELASAILARIVTEYTTDEQQAAGPGTESTGTRSLSNVLRVAGPQHPIARALRRLASDVNVTDTSEAL
ncbi:hypothetical protein [Streptomyces sp. NBC_01462]|uniref:hypothetical protein n=1 Tax=Streptomyces sp. NBC_01462 TaxID=2903876 RepID=UPI002E365B2F|nr:hypothetical protein [Streptomyces sp. NBC_01462]